MTAIRATAVLPWVRIMMLVSPERLAVTMPLSFI
jgi:hypothetical protein